MIRHINVENFKSIVNDGITLSNLTAIIGANGTGKSNLIKAIDFVSTIANIGLVAAVNKFGGYSGIVPKWIPSSQVKKVHVSFDYDVELRPPLSSHPDDLPAFIVNHRFVFGHSYKYTVRVIKESIVYNQTFAMIESLQEDLPKLGIDDATLEIAKDSGRVVQYEPTPVFSGDNLNHYVEWFGLPFRTARLKNVRNLQTFLKYLEVVLRQDNLTSQTFTDPSRANITDYSRHSHRFLEALRNTRRYDLLLSELRQEQQLTESPFLSSIGNNMPAVFRHLRTITRDSSAIERIASTMNEISPHIDSFAYTKVRTGKEFIEFLESTSKRSVESWESSDGTLRTLAILLALETQAPYSSILIEEPEQNLHPWAIRSIIDHIRQTIEARKIQVILTTHSQQLLEALNPDEVLVATRSRENGTKFHGLGELAPRGNIEMGEIGRMWVKGLLGGVPSID